MQLFRRLRNMPASERRLAAEATATLAVAAIVLSFFSFRRIAASAARRIANGIADEGERRRQVALVGSTVVACARRVPWRAKCFEQGLAAQWMLGRRGVPSSLHYGIAKNDDQRLVAHVWLRSGTLDVVGCENEAEFTELARFPAERP